MKYLKVKNFPRLQNCDNKLSLACIPCVDFGMCMSKIRAKKCLKIKKAHYHLVIFRKLCTQIIQKHQNKTSFHILCMKYLRACSYDPAYRDVSLTETNISVRSYGIFRPACRDEITM
jgi:hypothetical protein